MLNLDNSNGTPPVRQRASRNADHVEQVIGVYLVVVETTAGKYRRRSCLSLSSAQRAVERAELAGHPATAVLARVEQAWALG